MNFEKYKPSVRFLLIATALYIIWYFLYDLWLHPQGAADLFVVNNTIRTSRFLLEQMGFDVYIEPRTIGITKTLGVWIGDSCNGILLFALFTGFIIAFPGKIRYKLFFIPAGILMIHLMNIIRITGLVMVDYYSPHLLEFNHTYTFTFLIYIFIFLLWMTWVKRFSGIATIKPSSHES